jgi:hypothetical protein
MLEADTLFTYPPYKIGMVNGYYTKAGCLHIPFGFDVFSRHLLRCIDQIDPRDMFLEMGRQYVEWYAAEFRRRWPYVVVYPSTYYHRKISRCFVLYASRGPIGQAYRVLAGMDEIDIIAWVCRHHPYKCIGDLCMG